jgi:hypothetical protein
MKHQPAGPGRPTELTKCLWHLNTTITHQRCNPYNPLTSLSPRQEKVQGSMAAKSHFNSNGSVGNVPPSFYASQPTRSSWLQTGWSSCSVRGLKSCEQTPPMRSKKRDNMP